MHIIIFKSAMNSLLSILLATLNPDKYNNKIIYYNDRYTPWKVENIVTTLRI